MVKHAMDNCKPDEVLIRHNLDTNTFYDCENLASK